MSQNAVVIFLQNQIKGWTDLHRTVFIYHFFSISNSQKKRKENNLGGKKYKTNKINDKIK